MNRLTVSNLDHIVLKVRDIERSLEFYCAILGLRAERLDEFKAGKAGFPSVRIDGQTVIDLLPTADNTALKSAQNLQHFCLVAQGQNIDQVTQYLNQQNIAIHEGPARRWGARGYAMSVYFDDPDGNQIEIRIYESA